MSEYKMKKLIGTGTVEREISPPRIKYLVYSSVDLDKIPRRTKVELFIEVSPERKVVRPDDMRWSVSKAVDDNYDLWSSDLEVGGIAYICESLKDNFTLYVDHKVQTHESLSTAMNACEEYLADNGLFGFKWESEVEPVAWDVEWIGENERLGQSRFFDEPYTLDAYREKVKTTKARLWAITADLERWEVVDV